jgi:hypothetical protein
MSTARGTWHPSSSRVRCTYDGSARALCGDSRPSPYTGPLDVFGQRSPAIARSATAVLRKHERGEDEQQVGALSELIG